MGPTPNRSSALQHFVRGNALEIRNEIMFDFYPGLLHVYTCNFMSYLLDVVDLCLYHMLYNGGIHSQGVAGDREGVGAD